MASNLFDGRFQIWLFVPSCQEQFSDSSMLHHICFLRTDYSIISYLVALSANMHFVLRQEAISYEIFKESP